MDQDDATFLAAPADRADETGETIGRYRVLRELGRGGMGTVLLAVDTELGREVAIKRVYSVEGITKETRARFTREARSAARLSHPNIATIYDVGSVGDEPYIAMEYVAGQSLSERLRHGPLSIERALAVLRQLASALASAHAAGVVHRDLKPGNVMVSTRGMVKLLDFGLAQLGAGEGEEPLTRTGAVMGTPAYMSPEQVRGERVGPTSDVFALGAVMHEALTGKSPFARAGVYATLNAVGTYQPEAVSVLRPETPHALSDLVAACLGKEAALRPSAASLVAALEGDLTPVSSPRAPASVAGRVALLPMRNVTGATEHDWVGSGLVDTLGHELRRSEGTTLADAAATGALYEEGLSPRELGDRLGAEWVVAGAFQVAGPLLRITCSAHHVPDGEETGCERVDGKLDDIFDAQDRLVAAVRAVLATRRRRSPSMGTTGGGRPRDMRAYEAYARGLLAMRTSTESGGRAAEGYFRRALALAPDYAEAWAGLGSVLQLDFLLRGAPVLDESVGCLEKAIDLDPNHALAHAWLSQACNFLGDHARGLEAGERAVELDPAHLDCWLFLGLNQLCMTLCHGEVQWMARGMQSLERALSLVPHYASIHHNIAVMLLLVGDLARAEDHFRTCDSLERGGSQHERWPAGDAYIGIVDLYRGDLDAAEPRLARAAAVLADDDHVFSLPMAAALDLAYAELLHRTRRFDEASRVYERALGMARCDAPGMAHGRIRAQLGQVRVWHARGEDRREALERLREELLDLAVLGNWGYDQFAPHSLFDAAAVHAELGLPDRAMELLARAVDHGMLCPARLDTSPAFDALRHDDRLRAQRDRMAAYTPLPTV